MYDGSRWPTGVFTRSFPRWWGEFESGGRENGNGSGKWKMGVRFRPLPVSVFPEQRVRMENGRRHGTQINV